MDLLSMTLSNHFFNLLIHYLDPQLPLMTNSRSSLPSA